MKILILAAGRSSRFNGACSKVLTKFWGVRVVDMLIARANNVGQTYIMVNENVDKAIKHNRKIVQDMNNYGTGAAVQQYVSNMEEDDLLVIPGDLPLLDEAAMQKVTNTPGDIVIGVMRMPEGAEQYGRIIMEGDHVKAIVEHRFHEEKTQFANTGVILIRKNALHLIKDLKKNSSGEIYLTDIVQLANQAGLQVGISSLLYNCVLGFNTVDELNQLLQLAQINWRNRAVESGAVFYDISKVYFSYDTKIEQGVVVEPNCYFGPGVVLKSGAYIKTFSVFSDCVVSGAVGPFAHIKSGSIAHGSQVGAFVEVSKSDVAQGAKIKHLAYIGNAKIGENSNVGAGVVVCNYDGKNKSETEIGKNVMVGANSSLIAPISIGDSAFLAAGGVYTKNIEEMEFAIARARQENKGKKQDV